MPDQPTILLVDDEEMVLTSLSSLLQLETEYNVHTFTSAKKALEFIEQNEVDLVISDYLMPEMDGITFLGNVRNIKPDIPRIVLITMNKNSTCDRPNTKPPIDDQ